MVYEWHDCRARRTNLIKVLSAMAAGGIVAAVPVWFVVEAISRCRLDERH